MQNDEDSTIGGVHKYMNTKLTAQVSVNADIVENDIVIYPADSNETYRVWRVIPRSNRSSLKTIIAINEVRNDR